LASKDPNYLANLRFMFKMLKIYFSRSKLIIFLP
jgi:hypothetical protein